MDSSGGLLFIFMILGTLATLFYFLPTIIAVVSKKPNWLAVFVLNLFLGWTALGWIVALIMAVWKKENPTIHYHTHQPAGVENQEGETPFQEHSPVPPEERDITRWRN